MKTNYSIGSTSGTYFESRRQDGVDTPPSLRFPGLWPVNPYVTSRVSEINNKTKYCWGSANGNDVTSAEYTPRNIVPYTRTNLSPPSESVVISALADKWRNTDLNIGMYLSPEGRESISMSTDLLMRLANSARALKRGDFGGFVRDLHELPRKHRKVAHKKFEQGDISGAFLSAHLGWSPLIKDSFSLLEGVEDIPEKPFRVTASKKSTAVSFSTASTVAHELALRDNFFRTQLTLDVKRPPTFTQRFGLDNPFLIAWELVPLSFVADYFLPIGATIDSMGFISQVYGSKGFRRTVKVVDYSIHVRRNTLVNRTKLWFTKSDAEHRRKEFNFERQKWTVSFTDPLRSARVTLPASLMKLSTISALAHQRILALGRR